MTTGTVIGSIGLECPWWSRWDKLASLSIFVAIINPPFQRSQPKNRDSRNARSKFVHRTPVLNPDFVQRTGLKPKTFRSSIGSGPLDPSSSWVWNALDSDLERSLNPWQGWCFSKIGKDFGSVQFFGLWNFSIESNSEQAASQAASKLFFWSSFLFFWYAIIAWLQGCNLFRVSNCHSKP